MSQKAAHSPELLERASRIKLLLMDCDGVLTDGRIYLLPAPGGGLFETKAFGSQDGIALQWAHRSGIETGIISGRTSPAVEERARVAESVPRTCDPRQVGLGRGEDDAQGRRRVGQTRVDRLARQLEGVAAFAQRRLPARVDAIQEGI